MQFNSFNFYSMNAQNESRSKKEYDSALGIIKKIEACRTIKEVKKLLSEELGIKKCVENYRIGTLGYLTLKDTKEAFDVIIKYSNEVHRCNFPKLKKAEPKRPRLILEGV